MSGNENLSRKDQLEGIATRLFNKKGYAASSMRDLAQEIGIKAASIYSHFDSKEEILLSICTKMADKFFYALEDIERSSCGNMTDKLEKCIVAHIKIITNDVAAAQVFMNEWKHLSEPYLSQFIKKRQAYETYFLDLLDDGINHNNIRKVDSKFAMLTILSSLNWIPIWYKPSGKMSPEEIGKELCSILIKGIGVSN